MESKKMYAKLDGKTVVPCTFDEWMTFSIGERVPIQVALSTVGDIIFISTIFIGLPSGFVLKPFETMIFGGEYHDEKYRWATYEEAEKGHNQLVEKVKQAYNERPENSIFKHD